MVPPEVDAAIAIPSGAGSRGNESPAHAAATQSKPCETEQITEKG